MLSSQIQFLEAFGSLSFEREAERCQMDLSYTHF